MSHSFAVSPANRIAMLLAALVCALAAAPASAKVKGFAYGVAAGEVTHNSVQIWAAAKGEGKVTGEVATDKKFKKVVETEGVKANDSRDGTVQTVIGKLKPEKPYFYRFCAKKECSDKGTFNTAPKPSKDTQIEFAYTGDADGTSLQGASSPFFGNFEVYNTMRKEGNDFNINLGDTIYSDSGVAGGPPALTTKEKWAKYKQNLSVKNLRRLRGSAGFYSHWDDHEFINDFSIPENGEALYKAGVDAFTDYAPVEYTSQEGLYRTFRWGRNAELFFLDERSFRSAKASAGGTCNNPQTNSPDLAPTAPQNVRNAFSALVPSLSEQVSKDCLDTINDPNRTMLGQGQLNQFIQDVTNSTARWKIIINETPIQQFYALPYDRWEGYAHERVALLSALEGANVNNLVFLTTDSHAAFANVVRYRTLNGDSAPANAPNEPVPIASRYSDFIIGPVGTNTFWAEIDDVTGQAGNGRLVSNAFFKPPPPNGMGMACAQGDVFSYGEVTVDGNQLIIEFKDQSGNTVIDVNDQPCGPYMLQAQ